MDVDLKLLRHALVLAKHRHFGRAATALKVSQPTLSRNIATLEKQLGMPVFERSRRDVTATPGGDELLRMADELIARADALSNRMELLRDGRGGRLRIVAGAFIDDIAVQPAAIEFIRANPSVRLEILEREWTAALYALMSDQADFAVFDILALRNMPTLRVDSLGLLQGVYFCRAGHPLLATPDPLPADLQKYPLVAPSLSVSRMAFITDMDSGARIDERGGGISPSIAVSSFRSALDIVAETDAISLGHPTQIAEGIAAGHLAHLRLPGIPSLPSVEMGVAWKRERTLPPAARAFIDLIRKRVRLARAAESTVAPGTTRRRPRRS
jgi:DNA-binding transcriptional LysR family regulator